MANQGEICEEKKETVATGLFGSPSWLEKAEQRKVEIQIEL